MCIRDSQYGTPDAFYPSLVGGQTLNGYYVDGVSLTHGSTPHIKHIWTFAVANDEVVSYSSRSCECINPANHNIPNPPTSIGNDYFCATGSHQLVQRNAFYVNLQLWDGKGYGHVNTCCAMNHPPWFVKDLYQPAIDEIEMRVCRDEDQADEDVAIESYEIYVH